MIELPFSDEELEAAFRRGFLREARRTSQSLRWCRGPGCIYCAEGIRHITRDGRARPEAR